MRDRSIFDASWRPITQLLGQEPLNTLFDSILTECSFRPGRGEIFNIFRMPIEDIKVVVFIQDLYTFNRMDFSHLEKQGVFILHSALTVETGKAGSHAKYWETFIKRVVTHIALTNPCIWLFLGSGVKNFISSIQNEAFYLTSYDETTINEIPINDDWNYIVPELYPTTNTRKVGFFSSKYFDYTNTVLEKKNLPRINWETN